MLNGTDIVRLPGPADREQTPPKSEASCSEAHRPGDTTKKQRPVKSGTGSEAQERSHQNRQVEISGTPEFGSTRGDSATPSQASRKGLFKLVPNVIVLTCRDAIGLPGGPAGKRNAQAIRKAQIFSQENDRKDASPALNGGAKSRGTAVPSRAHPPGLFIQSPHRYLVDQWSCHLASRHDSRKGEYRSHPPSPEILSRGQGEGHLARA